MLWTPIFAAVVLNVLGLTRGVNRCAVAVKVGSLRVVTKRPVLRKRLEDARMPGVLG